MLNYFIVDLTALHVSSRDELLSELVDFYKQEVGAIGSTITREIFVKPGVSKAGLHGPFWAFQTKSVSGFVNVRSQVLVGLHGPDLSSGHIITISTSAQVFNQFQSFASHIFQEFHLSNRAAEAQHGTIRAASKQRRVLSREDFASSSV